MILIADLIPWQFYRLKKFLTSNLSMHTKIQSLAKTKEIIILNKFKTFCGRGGGDEPSNHLGIVGDCSNWTSVDSVQSTSVQI